VLVGVLELELELLLDPHAARASAAVNAVRMTTALFKAAPLLRLAMAGTLSL
jgi:hypothetical protein